MRGWWIECGGYVTWFLRVVLCLKIRDLLYKGKGKRTEFKNYRGISLSMVGNIYSGTLVDRVPRVTGDLIDGEQGSFRARKGCVDQIYTLKQIGEKPREFYRLGEGV